MRLLDVLNSSNKKSLQYGSRGLSSTPGATPPARVTRSTAVVGDAPSTLGGKQKAGHSGAPAREDSPDRVSSNPEAENVVEGDGLKRKLKKPVGGKIKKQRKSRGVDFIVGDVSDTADERTGSSKVGHPVQREVLEVSEDRDTPPASPKFGYVSHPTKDKAPTTSGLEKGILDSFSAGISSFCVFRLPPGDKLFGNFFTDIDYVLATLSEDNAGARTLSAREIHVPGWNLFVDSTLDSARSRREFLSHALPPSLQFQGGKLSIAEMVEGLDRANVEMSFYGDCVSKALMDLRQSSSESTVAALKLRMENLINESDGMQLELKKQKLELVANVTAISEKDEEIGALKSRLAHAENQLKSSVGRISELEGMVTGSEERRILAEEQVANSESTRADSVRKALTHFSVGLTNSEEFWGPVAHALSCAGRKSGQEMLALLSSKYPISGLNMEELDEYDPQAGMDYEQAVSTLNDASFPFLQKLLDSAHLPINDLLQVQPDQASTDSAGN